MKNQNQWLKLILVSVVAFIMSIGFAFSAMAESGATLKVGFVDINKIMRDSVAAKNARAIYQKDFESKRATIKEKSDKVANMEKDLKGTKQDAPAWKDKRDKLAQEVKELKRLDSDLGEQLKKKDVELTQKIVTDLQQIIKKFSASEKYSIIWDKRTALVADDGLDVTDKIIKIYDAQKK
jgi:outer membrane protein